MNTQIIYPELGEKTNVDIEYSCSNSGGFYLTTALNLKGRGIHMSGNGTDHKRGKKTYQVTEAAFLKIKKIHSSCYIASL